MVALQALGLNSVRRHCLLLTASDSFDPITYPKKILKWTGLSVGQFQAFVRELMSQMSTVLNPDYVENAQ